MSNNHPRTKMRSWPLIFVALILILFGSVLVFIAATNVSSFGWWSLPIGTSGLTLIFTAANVDYQKDPSWIMLDLLLQRV